jgi:NAD(P)-dependent dehydrogenase (short-subunit alcohol dehydrogenase family)
MPQQPAPKAVSDVPGEPKREKSLAGRVALVTGGTRGIGAAICHGLAADGAVVAAGFSSNRGRADELRQSIETDGGTLSLHQGNVGDWEDCQRVVHDVINEHGRLDILVNNAGVTVDKPVWKMSMEDWHKVLAREPVGGLLHVQAGDRAHARARLGADHLHLVGDRRDRQHRPGELRGLEVGGSSGSRSRSPRRRRSRSGCPASSSTGSA